MSKRRSKARAASRLAAVQALYQLDMEEIGLARLLGQFHEHRLGKEIEDAQLIDADLVGGKAPSPCCTLHLRARTMSAL